MLVVAGILLGLVVVASLIGFHSGPHTHLAAGALGLVLAAWLVVMAIDGRSAPVLWALFSADLVISTGLAVMAWHGLASGGASVGRHFDSLEGAEGVAVSDLVPDGIVRVRGEQWSVVSVNGNVRAGGLVHVLNAGGVRLDVWAENPEPVPADRTLGLGAKNKERNT